MALIDYLIVLAYLIAMVLVGLYFQKKASSDIDSYFLGGRRMPWWLLGASGMSSNLDISGTMINVALIYAIGASGFFIEIRGGLVLILAFLMVYMGKWNRRSEAMTLAEWMELRFGDGTEGKLARLITAAAIILSSVAIISYFAVGAGKFIGEFLGIPQFFGLPSEFWAALLMIILAMIYTVASGLYGVVWTDVFQGVLIFSVIIIICAIAMIYYDLPDKFTVSTPAISGGYLEIPTTREEWTNVFPKWNLGLPSESAYSIYNLFGIAIIFYLIKLIIEGAGGTGGYMIQRFFASRSDREAGLLSVFWIFLLSFRWPFIAAIAIMGISIGLEGGAIIQDPEKVLPSVIASLLPIGLKGFLVAGLMAAAMSTFDSIVNAGASYWVKDIYQSSINKNASQKQLIFQSRLSSVIMVAAGLGLTLNIESINDIWGWLTMGLGSGLIIPLLLRWYWQRLNGYGFSLGVFLGMTVAIVQKLNYPSLEEYWIFGVVAGFSLLGCVIGSYLTKPTPDSVLLNFYRKTRPFGFWNRIRKTFNQEKIIKIKKENSRDIFSTFLAVPWQLTLFLTMMTIVLKKWDYFAILLMALIFLSVGLYFTWFRNLSDENNLD